MVINSIWLEACTGIEQTLFSFFSSVYYPDARRKPSDGKNRGSKAKGEGRKPRNNTIFLPLKMIFEKKEPKMLALLQSGAHSMKITFSNFVEFNFIRAIVTIIRYEWFFMWRSIHSTHKTIWVFSHPSSILVWPLSLCISLFFSLSLLVMLLLLLLSIALSCDYERVFIWHETQAGMILTRFGSVD